MTAECKKRKREEIFYFKEQGDHKKRKTYYNVNQIEILFRRLKIQEDRVISNEYYFSDFQKSINYERIDNRLQKNSRFKT